MPKTPYKKKNTALTEKQKKAVVQIAKTVNNKAAEHKLYAKSVSSAVVTDAAGFRAEEITTVPQGVLDNNRVGDEITIDHIDIRMMLQNYLGINGYGDVLWRVFVFQYNDNNNTPDIDQLLLTSTANIGNVAGSYSARNIDYLRSYNVLYDKTFQTFGSNGAVVTPGYDYTDAKKLVHIKVPLKYAKKKIQFEAGTATATNGIWMLVTCDKDIVANNSTIRYMVSTGYTDS